MTLTYYTKKENALKKQKDQEILCNRGITKYFLAKNYTEFSDIIQTSKRKDFYEYIDGDRPVKLFFDIELYDKETDAYFQNYKSLMDDILTKIESYLYKTYTEIEIKRIVLESHSTTKKSFHIIYNTTVSKEVDSQLVFENVLELKRLWKYLEFDKLKQDKKYIVDPSVYRAGLFRTIYSSKNEEPPRPLIPSIEFGTLTDGDLSIEDTFVGNVKNIDFFETIEINDDNEITNIPEELDDMDRSLIKRFINQNYHFSDDKIRDVLVDLNKNCIIIALVDHYCHFIKREHRSNNQYIIIDTTSSKQRCHDSECTNYNYNEIKMEDYPKEINFIIKKCLQINRQELDLIDYAIEECKTYINENFDQSLDTMQFDRNEMVFRGDVGNSSLVNMISGTCESCRVEHQISNTGYCIKCIVCKSIFPRNQLIPIDDRYRNLNNFWMNYSQLINNGTVNINIYQGEEDFICDVKLDNSIFRNAELTKVYNQILDGHKITKIAEVIYMQNKDFVYTKNHWYYFNGNIWKMDEDNLVLKRSILDSSNYFNKITHYYENRRRGESSHQLIKNVKSLITKLNKPGFKDDIIKEAKMFYNDPDFMSKLNSKKHLVPFTNGVYDLLTGKFRETSKEDYINLTVNYDYDPDANNQEVYTFLEQVLPNKGVRDYVLKKMSECLNGDIPNTYFLMFIGDTGANGKSQLLNLMKLAMGEFGEKVEVTLLTRKRNNANEANTEKIKLWNKRFAFLSEPEDGEKINIGLLKELTGSEEVVARGLYQEAVSFVMEAKLFLACNELPEIKGEDTALWRRIRVIDFPSRFVDEPKEEGEYKIDRTLPSRMREDPTWRQTFMKILLNYYFMDIKEPTEVLVKTNEYRKENNDFYNWLEENIEYKEDAVLKLQDTVELFSGKKISSRHLNKYRKEIEKFIKEKFTKVDHEYKQFWIQEIKYKGWKNLEVNH